MSRRRRVAAGAARPLRWSRRSPRWSSPPLISSVVLLISGNDPVDAFRSMCDYGTEPGTMVDILNQGDATTSRRSRWPSASG